MTTMATPQPDTADDVLEAVAGLAPSIRERAPEVEAARRLPADLLEELVAAGCFRTLLPRSHGGLEAPLPDAMRVVEALSRADASVGWTVMIGAATWIDLAGLPRPTFDGLYAAGPDVMIAGVFSPAGAAVPMEGGYQVSGRWGFASGSPHADWIYGNCVEQVEGGHRLRIALFTLDEAQVEDTWNVVGLRGTGSHHFHVDGAVVPAERTWPVLEGEHTVDTPVVRIPPPSLFSMSIAAMAVGTAQGALDEVTRLAATKVPLLAGSALATSPTFHVQLAEADTHLRSIRSLVYDLAGEAWTAASEGAPLTPEQRARIRAASASAVRIAAEVVTMAYRSGGGSAIYLDSPLQRRLRDISAVTQHFLVRPDTMANAGALLAGQEIELPVF